jgi:hypothetical protein
MQLEYDCDIQLNKFGEPDVDYYITKAHEMRGEAIGTAFATVKVWLLKCLDRVWSPDRPHSHAPRRVV